MLQAWHDVREDDAARMAGCMQMLHGAGRPGTQPSDWKSITASRLAEFMLVGCWRPHRLLLIHYSLLLLPCLLLPLLRRSDALNQV